MAIDRFKDIDKAFIEQLSDLVIIIPIISTDTGPIHFFLYDTPGYGDFINNQFSFDV